MASQISASPIYSDIDPHCEWIEGEDTNIFKVDVPGFKKQQLKAQVDTSKNLKVSGERHIDGNQWFRFQKTFKLPKTCDIGKIRARLDTNGSLYVMVPKNSALDPIPSQNGKTTTTTVSKDEEQSNKIKGSSLKEKIEEPERGVVRNLWKQKIVILNVVIAATLLVLVLFRRYKLADGDIFGGHKIEQHTN